MPSIQDMADYGYDPTVEEPGPLTTPTPPAAPLPLSATVDTTFLPPVGHQTTPSCFVWASTYGLATFAAAQAGNYSPSDAAQQASPGYTYVQVLMDEGTATDTCVGGQMTACFNFLESNGGTPSMQAAPTPDGCAAVWSDYGPGTSPIPPDDAFDVTAWAKVSVTGTDGLNNVRTLIAQGIPLAWGTRLYTDFAHYDGQPSPYVGNGIIAKKPDGSPVGHCMMIIGYDDGMNAILVQNSFGTGWGSTYNGSGGFVWMTYATFQTLAQGTALYITAG